jgi:hypothetical protein
MMVEDEGSTKGGLNCSKYPQYCINGKKKSSKELLEMRVKPKDEGSSQRNDKSSNETSPFDEIIQNISFAVQGMHLLDLVEDGIQWGRPAYRQIKYALPLGGLEWGVDAGLQLYDDRDLDLSPWDRGGRALVRFGESAAIDGLSSGVGLSSAAALQVSSPEAPVAAAGVGYVVGSYSTSTILDNIAKQENPALFSWLGLGGP